MNDAALTLFVVDDDPATRMIALHELEGLPFRMLEFDSADACLAAMDLNPDVLLLDVEMPGMDGIALCRKLRDEGNDHARIIFVSAHDDLDTRLAAYDAGGNDFIAKPFAPEELARKVRVAERLLSARSELQAQASFAQQAAFTAMSSMGEMGTVLEFMRGSFACGDLESLARALQETLGQYGLRSLISLRQGARVHYFCAQGGCTELEASILKQSAGLQRIFQFRDRLAVNYPNVTLLVLNLPLDDPDRVGRMRDYLAILAEAAEARLAALASETQRQSQDQGIRQAVTELTRALSQVEERQEAVRFRSLEATNAYMNQLDQAFIHLGLTEGQESALVTMAREAMSRIGELLGEEKALGGQLRGVTDQLRDLVGQESAKCAG